jgi:hypothetical protein
MLTEEKISEFEDKIAGYSNEGTLIEGIFVGQISCLTSLDGDISTTAVNAGYSEIKQKHKVLMTDIDNMFNSLLMQMREMLAEYTVVLTTIDDMQQEINTLKAAIDGAKTAKKKNNQVTENQV